MQFWILIDALLNIVDAIVDKLKVIRNFFLELMDKKFLVLFVMGLTLIVAKLISWIRGTDDEDDPEVGASRWDSEMESEGHVSSKLSESEARKAKTPSTPPNQELPTKRQIEAVPERPIGSKKVRTPGTSKSYSSGINIPVAPKRSIENFDAEIKKITARHTNWKVSRTLSDRNGRYPGCPSHGIQGTIDDYEGHILLSVNTLMSKAGLDVNAACGITGCLMAESGLLPIAFNRTAGGYGAQGIAQWRQWNKDPKVVAKYGRGRIGNYVHLYGVMPVYDDNIYHQLDFVCWELANNPGLRVANGQSLRNATYQGFTRYEGANGDPHAHFSSRYKCAQRAYNLYISTKGVKGSIRITKDKKVVSNKYNQ